MATYEAAPISGARFNLGEGTLWDERTQRFLWVDLLGGDVAEYSLNCVFMGEDLIITEFGDITEVTSEAPMDGRLWRVPVKTKGQPLFRGAIK